MQPLPTAAAPSLWAGIAGYVGGAVHCPSLLVEGSGSVWPLGTGVVFATLPLPCHTLSLVQEECGHLPGPGHALHDLCSLSKDSQLRAPSAVGKIRVISALLCWGWQVLATRLKVRFIPSINTSPYMQPRIILHPRNRDVTPSSCISILPPTLLLTQEHIWAASANQSAWKGSVTEG